MLCTHKRIKIDGGPSYVFLSQAVRAAPEKFRQMLVRAGCFLRLF